ncbi:DUF2971 domain-containing protein [Rhodococcus oryzae]|uniref:DUF2971 domain-containing protein n=1 Tax=Rhodococcus oryzae TaxID=2571143 RepID=UPI003711D2BF
MPLSDELQPTLDDYLTPPPLLFHYTSDAGLQGIIESGTVWATDIAYLNDSRELKHGFDLLKKALIDIEDGTWTSDLADLVTNAFTAPLAFRIMVACFCERGDLLGQWRGYSTSCGYSIGLDATKVNNILEARGQMPLRRIVYDNEVARKMAVVWAKFVDDAWRPVVEKLKQDGLTDDDRGRAMYEFSGEHVGNAAAACTGLKDPAFVEEREWRTLSIVQSGPNSKSGSGMKFRQGPIGLTPYIAIDLRDSTGKLPIEKVIVGPGPNLDLRMDAAEMFLHRHNYGDVEIVPSSIPYRPA